MKIPATLIYAATALVLCTLSLSPSTASTEKVLYSLPSNATPFGRPDQDNKGALYGTAGFLDGSGAIFRLKQKKGVWTYKTLLDFNGGSGGRLPWAGPLIDRNTGVLYGTTMGGGNSNDGTVYSVSPTGHRWTETVLHSFSGSDGAFPEGALLRDKATGNFFGTTSYGGTGNCGTAFQLSQSNGGWSFRTIYNFMGGNDACSSFTQLKPGAKPGTMIGAGSTSSGKGQMFQLKESNGIWSDSILYTFTGRGDGRFPWDIDASSDGTIYGVTNDGGLYGCGGVFKLTPNLKGRYTFSVIYNFRGGNDGAGGSGINFDAATGNLYGTTGSGGTANLGTVFRLAPNGKSWIETVLHSFTGGSDGNSPYSRPLVDRTTGALYGTTTASGANNGGVIYMVQP